MGLFVKRSSRRGSLSRPERSGMRLEKSAGAGVVLEPSSNQPIDGFLVDAHDLVDLDLLSGDIDRCFAKAWNVDAIRDRLAIEHELGDRNHGITCISGVPQKTFADGVIRDQRFRLARQYGADHGDLLAKALLTHRVAGPDRSVRAEAENTTQVRIGLDHVKRRALAGVDLVGAGETVGDELHFGKVLLLIGNRGVGPLVVKRRRQGPDIDHIIAFTTHVLGETLHLHLTEATESINSTFQSRPSCSGPSCVMTLIPAAWARLSTGSHTFTSSGTRPITLTFLAIRSSSSFTCCAGSTFAGPTIVALMLKSLAPF